MEVHERSNHSDLCYGSRLVDERDDVLNVFVSDSRSLFLHPLTVFVLVHCLSLESHGPRRTSIGLLKFWLWTTWYFFSASS